MIRPVLAQGEAPAAKAAILLVAGIFTGAWSVTGPRAGWALVGVSLAGLVLTRSRGASRLAFVSFWFAAGFVSGQLGVARPAVRAREAFRSADAADLRAVRLEGVLADFWSGQPPRARSTLAASRLETSGGPREFPAEVALFVSGESPVLAAADRGDRVRLTGHLEEEDLPASDREVTVPSPRYRLSIKSSRLVEREGLTLVSALTAPNRWLFASLPSNQGAAYERDVRGPLCAILLGRTAEVDRGMVARYRRGGLYHLLVVSGLHVLLAAGLCAAVLGFLGIEGKVRDAGLLFAVLLFVLVGGANPPAVRAGLVVATFLLTRLLERPITSAQAIGLSALVLFLASPSQIFSVGVVLTFAAVCGIALFSRPIRSRLPRWPDWLFSSIAAALAAECATAPVLLWRFNIVAAGAWLTAPLTVPLAGALIACGALLLVSYAAGIPAGPLAALFGAGSRTLELLADRAAGCALLRPTPPFGAVCVTGVLLALAGAGPVRLRRPCAVAAGALFAALALRRGPAGPSRGFSIEALDVGQGDAILLRWARRAVLVDGGGSFDPMAVDFGRTRLVPKLLDRGVTRLDAVLATHPHPDHALGLFAAIEELEVGELWRSSGEDEGELFGRLEATAASHGVRVRRLEPLDVWEREGARISVLHSGGFRHKTDGINNQSVVALFERDGRSALLTGDAGAPAEEELVRSGASGPVDALKVGHHGSRTATTAGFLEVLRPRLALISCGRRNRFGHPSPEALAALERFCVPVFRTDERSDVRAELRPDGTRLSWRGALRP